VKLGHGLRQHRRGHIDLMLDGAELLLGAGLPLA